MDDVQAQHLRKGHFPRSSTSSLLENTGRVRGRTQQRHHHSASFASNSAASDSTPLESGASSSSVGGAGVNKIWSNMRRSLSSSKKPQTGLAVMGMHSTPVESLPPSPSRYNYHDSLATSPTIEQIAMGLHISRTPHLGSSSKAYHSRTRLPDTPETPLGVSTPPRPTRPSHVRRGSAPTISLPPPPARSSMKKPPSASSHSNPLTPSDSNASLSTLTSTAPSTPRSNRSVSKARPIAQNTFSSKLHLGMRLLLPTRKNASAATLSDDDSASSELTPRKVVRFSVISGESESRS